MCNIGLTIRDGPLALRDIGLVPDVRLAIRDAPLAMRDIQLIPNVGLTIHDAPLAVHDVRLVPDVGLVPDIARNTTGNHIRVIPNVACNATRVRVPGVARRREGRHVLLSTTRPTTHRP